MMLMFNSVYSMIGTMRGVLEGKIIREREKDDKRLLAFNRVDLLVCV